jgi:tetratricopeptide (TPR) repeat protein
VYILTFFSCSEIPEKQNAEQFYNNGQFNEAITEYDKAILLSPSDCELFVGRADCNRRLKNYNKVIPDLEIAIKLGCAEGIDLNNLGDAYFKTGKAELAISYFEKAYDANFQKGTVSANLGICYSTLGQKDSADKFLMQAIKIDPDTSINYYYFGTHLQNHDSLDLALAFLNAAIDLKTDFPTYYIKRASILCGLSEYQKALEDVKSALTLNPSIEEITDALYLETFCFFKQGKVKEACNSFTKLKSIDPNVNFVEFKIDCGI